MTKTQCRQFSLGHSYLLQYCSTRLSSYFHILQRSTLYTQPMCIQLYTCVWCCIAVYAYPMLCIFPYAAQSINLSYLYCHKLLLLSLFSPTVFLTRAWFLQLRSRAQLLFSLFVLVLLNNPVRNNYEYGLIPHHRSQ